MKTATRDQFGYAFDPGATPVCEVALGEVFRVQMQDSQGGRITGASTLVQPHTDPGRVNPCTGPVAVRSTKPGDIIAIEVMELIPHTPGFSCVVPGDAVLGRESRAVTELWDIDGTNAVLRRDPRLRFPIAPLVGTLGSTPEKTVPTGHAGPHGGNLDNPLLGAGSRLYVPVFLPGALLWFGDCHASQADGEVMMPIEIEADGLFQVGRLDPRVAIPTPLVETCDRWATNFVAPTVEQAIHGATRTLVALLVARLNVSVETAALLVAAWGDIRLNQATGMGRCPAVVRGEIPKRIDQGGRLDMLL